MKSTKNLLSSNYKFPSSVDKVLKANPPEKIRQAFKSNKELLEKVKMPYELRGEYTPRTPINPFKKKPLTLIYDQSHFQGFVLPSRRQITYGMFDFEELFGIKRWRNDSPFIKEYIKIDNQIFFTVLLLSTFGLIYWSHVQQKKEKLHREIIISDMGIFCADDVK